MSIWRATRSCIAGAAAAVRHEQEAGAGVVLEIGRSDAMRHRRHPHRYLARVGLDPRDQLVQVLRGDRGIADDQLRIGSDQRHRLEVLEEIVRERIGRAVEHMGAPLADAQRIAVGRRAGDPADADAAVRPGDVLDDDGLPERHPHALGDDARDGIGRAAGGERDHQGDGTGRIGLRACARGDRVDRGQNQSGEELRCVTSAGLRLEDDDQL